MQLGNRPELLSVAPFFVELRLNLGECATVVKRAASRVRPQAEPGKQGPGEAAARGTLHGWSAAGLCPFDCRQLALIIGEQDPFLAQLLQECFDLQALEIEERLLLTIDPTGEND